MAESEIFFTRPPRKPTMFEIKYLERCSPSNEHRTSFSEFAIEVQEKEREVEEADQKLQDTKAKFERWKNQFVEKKKEIESHFAKLVEKKQLLDKFSLQNTHDLANLKEKENECKIQIEQYQADLLKIEAEEQKYAAINSQLSEEIKKLQPYADYLNLVIESESMYENPDSLLNKHSTLVKCKEDYMKIFQELMSNSGEVEKGLEIELENQKNKLTSSTLQFNDELTKQVQTRINNSFRKTSIIKDIQRLEDKQVEASLIKASIKAIYCRALERSSKQCDTSIESEDVSEEEMLRFIQERFHDLTTIIDGYNNESHN